MSTVAHAHRRYVLVGITLACAMAHAALLQAWNGPSVQAGSAAAPVLTVRTVERAAPTRAAELPAADAPVAGAPNGQAPRVARAHRASTPADNPVIPRADVPDVPDAPNLSAPIAAAAALPRHLPTDALEVRPLPRSSPDERHVDEVPRSGLPIRVRVFVESDGSVSDVEILSHAPGDEEAAAGVAQMFRETAFIPGRLAGSDVAAYMDIELALETALPPPIPLQPF